MRLQTVCSGSRKRTRKLSTSTMSTMTSRCFTSESVGSSRRMSASGSLEPLNLKPFLMPRVERRGFAGRAQSTKGQTSMQTTISEHYKPPVRFGLGGAPLTASISGRQRCNSPQRQISPRPWLSAPPASNRSSLTTAPCRSRSRRSSGRS